MTPPFPTALDAPFDDLHDAVSQARRAFDGLGAAALLSDVSVARAAAVLLQVVRDPDQWVRDLLSGLDAFRQVQPGHELAPLLSQAWNDPRAADRSLTRFADARVDAGEVALARLGFGPKIWFTMNGVAVAWRPLTAQFGAGPGEVVGSSPPDDVLDLDALETDRRVLALRALRSCGLTEDEALRVRLADVGRLAPGGVLVPDLLADPLAIRYVPRGEGRARLLFVTAAPRVAVLAHVFERYQFDAGCRHPDRLVVAPRDEIGVIA